MDNRYLYRAKQIDGEWVEGFLKQYPTGEWEIARKCDNPPDSDPMWQKVLITYKIEPNTICQCTGISDENGKLIFENDIVKFNDNIKINGITSHISKVEWNKEIGGFVFHADCIGYYTVNPSIIKKQSVVVIGSALENQKLMDEIKEKVTNEEQKPVTQVIKEIREKMCDGYCRFPMLYNPDIWEEVAEEVCKGCPLDRL